MMAAIDGIKNQIDPGKPLDRNIYEMDRRGGQAHPQHAGQPGGVDRAPAGRTTRSCWKAGVFTEDLIQGWIDYKYEYEIKPMALRPHPYEFHLYYDA